MWYCYATYMTKGRCQPFRMSRAAALAVHAAALIARAGGRRLRRREISDELGVSRDHLTKVLQKLARAGILSGGRGRTGGFTLGPRGAGASLLDVYRAVEPRVAGQRCPFGVPACGKGTCRLGRFLTEANDRLLGVMERTPVSAIFRDFNPDRGARRAQGVRS